MNEIIVCKQNTGDFCTIAEALASIQSGTATTIRIKAGTYNEKLIIDKPALHLVGDDVEGTIITHGDGAFMPDATGNPMGTFQTYTVLVTKEAEGFVAENITFQNAAGQGDIVGQAVAVYADADRMVFRNCRLLAHQDTLLAGPIFSDIEKNPDLYNRQYFENCYIEGDVDFIFGGAAAIFDHCEIFSKNRNKEINGYLTAACTSKNLDFGYVFFDCTLTGDAGDATVFLGRPWREYGKTVFIRCHMGAHIKKEGFSIWEGTNRHENCYYAQYQCSGPGYSEGHIASFTHILTDEQAERYTIDNIFKDWKITGK